MSNGSVDNGDEADGINCSNGICHILIKIKDRVVGEKCQHGFECYM